jgi:hypothetical protein
MESTSTTPDQDRADREDESHDSQPDKRSIDVSENKFNATVSFDIIGAKTAKEAKAAARRTFRDEYGHNPSNVAAERDVGVNPERWNVIVTDHTSGSLKPGRTLEITADPDAVKPDTDDDANHGDSDAPEGWSELAEEDRDTRVGQFRGGYERTGEPLEIRIYEAPTGEWGWVFPDEDGEEDQTESPRFEIDVVKNPDGITDIERYERGFEDDLPAAKEQAREVAEEYANEGADR